jgi:hypothetical protein
MLRFGEQRFQFFTKLTVPGTGLLEKRGSLRRITFQSLRVKNFDLLPPLRHAIYRSSRLSHARARLHLLFTVAGETPTTSAVSSMLSPPKKRSSTIRAC